MAENPNDKKKNADKKTEEISAENLDIGKHLLQADDLFLDLDPASGILATAGPEPGDGGGGGSDGGGSGPGCGCDSSSGSSK